MTTSGTFLVGTPFNNFSAQVQGPSDIFYRKFDSAGDWIFSALTGGSGDDIAYAVAVDPDDNPWFTVDGLHWIDSSLLGGNDGETFGYAIALDAEGDVYVGANTFAEASVSGPLPFHLILGLFQKKLVYQHTISWHTFERCLSIS